MDENNVNQPVSYEQAETVAENVGKAEEKSAFSKFLSQLKSLPLKKIIIFAVAAAAVICAVIFGGKIISNNYKTPVRIYEKYANKKNIDAEKYDLAVLNGFAEKDFRKLLKVAHNSEVFDEYIEELNDSHADLYEKRCDTYGDNFKIKYTVTEKTELESSELKEYKEDLQYTFDCFTEIADYAEDFDSSDWSDVADDLDMTKSSAKDFVKIIGEIGEKYERVKISKGYELEGTITITGSELDEPLESDLYLIVLKVNGRWISYGAYDQLGDIILYDMMFYYW